MTACLAQQAPATAMISKSAMRRSSGLFAATSSSTPSPSCLSSLASSISTPMPVRSVAAFARQTVPKSRLASAPRRSLAAAATATDADEAALKYDSLLVTLISAAGDPSSSSSSSSFSSSSRASLAAAGALARANGSKSVTVLLVDEAAPAPEANAPRLEAIAAALQASGVADPAAIKFLEKALDAESSHNASVAVGDAADECGADLLILHSDAVHAKRVDANLLAEFVDCPMLLLP